MPRFVRRTTRSRPISFPPEPSDPSTWTVAAARAIAQACAMGMVLPYPLLYPRHSRKEQR